jgi:hypothetical protein
MFHKIYGEFIPLIWNGVLVPAPRRPKGDKNSEPRKNGGAKNQDYKAMVSASIIEKRQNSVHDFTLDCRRCPSSPNALLGAATACGWLRPATF